MINRTWLGNQDNNNDASNPNNWSPTGVPQFGDTLTMSAGTMNITDNTLRGDPLNIDGPVTLNLSHHANATVESHSGGFPITINIFDTAFLNLHRSAPGGGSPIAVNLASHANLVGNFDIGLRDLVVLGDDHARWINLGTNTLTGSNANIGADVVGSGMFFIKSLGGGFRFDFPGSIEFGGSVSGGLVDLTGVIDTSTGRQLGATLKIDHPKDFHGTVDLHDLSVADLVGLAQADTWTYSHDLLFIKAAGGRVIDTLHVISDAPSTGSMHGLSLSKTAAGDVLVSPGIDFHGSLAVPLA